MDVKVFLSQTAVFWLTRYECNLASRSPYVLSLSIGSVLPFGAFCFPADPVICTRGRVTRARIRGAEVLRIFVRDR